MDKDVLKSIQANAKCHIDYDGGRYITHAQTMYDMATELLAHMDNGLSPAEVAELLAIGNQGGEKVMAAEKEANALRCKVNELEAENAKHVEDKKHIGVTIERMEVSWNEIQAAYAALTAERDELKASVDRMYRTAREEIEAITKERDQLEENHRWQQEQIDRLTAARNALKDDLRTFLHADNERGGKVWLHQRIVSREEYDRLRKMAEPSEEVEK